MKYVYLIQSLEDSRYKIGVSKHPTRRLVALQTGNPSPTKLIYTHQSEYAYMIEKTLQRRYGHLKKQGEWFDLSIEEEQLFLKNCKSIEENIIFLKKNNNAFI